MIIDVKFNLRTMNIMSAFILVSYVIFILWNKWKSSKLKVHHMTDNLFSLTGLEWKNSSVDEEVEQHCLSPWDQWPRLVQVSCDSSLTAPPSHLPPSCPASTPPGGISMSPCCTGTLLSQDQWAAATRLLSCPTALTQHGAQWTHISVTAPIGILFI